MFNFDAKEHRGCDIIFSMQIMQDGITSKGGQSWRRDVKSQLRQPGHFQVSKVVRGGGQ